MEEKIYRLVRNAQSGNKEAYLSLVSLYDKRILALVFRLLQNEQEAAAIYQALFLKLYQDLKKYRFEINFFNWLNYKTIDAVYRRSKKPDQVSYTEATPRTNTAIMNWASAESLELGEDSGLIKERRKNIFSQCANRGEIIFMLKQVENYRIVDIAKLLNCSKRTAKKYLCSTLEKIRRGMVS